MSQAEALQQLVDTHSRIVFFGGAGVSTASGIPDFRSADGLYNRRHHYPPEEILSHRFFVEHPEEFFAFYRQNLLVTGVVPNAAHHKLAELERAGRLTAVITQNIDGLHQQAGSQRVLELHGSIHRNYCDACGRRYPLQAVAEGEGIPRCGCGGALRPDVVLYGEQLDSAVLDAAIEALRAADLLLIGGTSLVVYPAAGLVRHFGGDAVAIINKSPTPQDTAADLLIDGDIARVMGALQIKKA